MNQKTSKLLRRAAVVMGATAVTKKQWHAAQPRQRAQWRQRLKQEVAG